MTPNEVFQQLVQKLYSCQLHFHLSETPFSAQILIRKKFLDNRLAASSADTTFPNAEISNLTNQISELQNKVRDASEVNDILEKKLGEAEAHALKNYEEKKVEIDILKNSVKKVKSRLKT